MTTVYMLWHVYEKDNGDDEEKLIGVYSTEAHAKNALELVKDQPGFRDYPNGFLIDPMTLDCSSWLEGFVTILHGVE